MDIGDGFVMDDYVIEAISNFSFPHVLSIVLKTDKQETESTFQHYLNRHEFQDVLYSVLH